MDGLSSYGLGPFEFHWLWILGAFLSFGGLTFLFPVLAVFCSLFSPKSGRLPAGKAPIRLEVLIPAYNEADTIERTLESVVNAGRRLLKLMPSVQIKITVALDGPKDATGKIARAYAAQVAQAQDAQALAQLNVEVLDRGFNRGKWATIGELVSQSQGFWSALVDSGTLWPEDFLVHLASRLESSDCVGIAPGYGHSGGGALVRLIWWQERLLKSIENFAGGPISLHGATMIFRTQELRQALRELSLRPSWLNDDVVIGLTLRMKGRIDYLGSALCVGDCGIREGASDIGRRKRMLLGNVEWIQEIFLKDCFRMIFETPVVSLLALRRIMRVLWAYNLLFAVFCFGMFLGEGWVASLGLTVALVALASTSRRLREPGWVSLTTPLLLFQKDSSIFWT
jgi:cellulose synthase/poly-beta-1,6-N-acetylglucosamine synthase-like glycosyltransferase